MNLLKSFGVCLLLLASGLSGTLRAADPAIAAKADQSLQKAVQFLLASQQPDGSWKPAPPAPPEVAVAYTGLSVSVLLRQPGMDHKHPAVAKGIEFLLSKQQDDGGIYDKILSNYNTSIALMGLGPVREKDPRYAEAVKKAQDYLRGLQWTEDEKDEKGNVIDPKHPHHGGQGYGNHGRPDLNNTFTFVKGMIDSGADCKDPAIQRAILFTAQLQGTKANELFGDQIVPDGGFIYAPSVNKDQVGEPQSMAGSVTDPTGRSRLRTYGTMTYAGFMSYLFAEIPADDPRVVDAYNWIRANYTLSQNPGMVDDEKTEKDERLQGYYYYLQLFSRGLRAWGARPDRPASENPDEIVLADGSRRNWTNDLIQLLVQMQKPDGSWVNEHDRWMEGEPQLVTCYAALAIQHALGR